MSLTAGCVIGGGEASALGSVGWGRAVSGRFWPYHFATSRCPNLHNMEIVFKALSVWSLFP